MASLLDPYIMSTLSVGGQRINSLDPNLIIDVIHIIKWSEIRNWRPLSVFAELKRSLLSFQRMEKNLQTPIMSIAFNGDDLIKFQISQQEPIYLTIRDIHRLMFMSPVPD